MNKFRQREQLKMIHIGKRLGKIYDRITPYTTYFSDRAHYNTFKFRFGIKFTHWRHHMEILRDPYMYFYFPPKEGNTIIDIGAQYGDYAILWAKHFQTKVIAFEPLSENFGEMFDDCALNDVLSVDLDKLDNGNVDCQKYFIGDGNPITFKQSGNMASKQEDGEKEDTITLDDFIQQNPYVIEPNIVKIDVEGFEMEVLKGAIDTIKTFHPKIIIETHSKELRKQCHEFLENLGYDLYFEGRTIKTKGWMDEVTNLFYAYRVRF
jgi:FkbM family methyltransferase